MPVTYKPAPDASAIIATLVDRVHTHLAEVEVRAWFRSEPRHAGGRDVLGDAKKVSGITAALVRHAEGGTDDALDHEEPGDLLSAPFFLLVLPETIWSVLDGERREALIDHLLCYCRVEGSEDGERLSIAVPDVAEFASVVARRGMWTDDIRRLVGAAYQSHPSLFTPDQLEALSSNVGAAAPGVTIEEAEGRFVLICTVCGTVADDDVREQLRTPAEEHIAWHANKAAAATTPEDEDGDEGMFGSAFDAKLDQLAEAESERRLRSVSP